MQQKYSPRNVYVCRDFCNIWNFAWVEFTFTELSHYKQWCTMYEHNSEFCCCKKSIKVYKINKFYSLSFSVPHTIDHNKGIWSKYKTLNSHLISLFQLWKFIEQNNPFGVGTVGVNAWTHHSRYFSYDDCEVVSNKWLYKHVGFVSANLL